MFYAQCSLILLVSLVLATGVNLLELPLDLDRVGSCQSSSCLLLKYRSLPQLLFKNSAEVGNLLLALYFFRLLGASGAAVEAAGGAARRESSLNNRLLRVVLIVEILANAVPNLISYFVNLVGRWVGPLEGIC